MENVNKCAYFAEQLGTRGACNAIPLEGKDVNPPACVVETEIVNLRTRNAMTRYWCNADNQAEIEACEACVARQISARTGQYRHKPPFK